MDLSKLKEIADIAQSLATVAAIILGGIWSYFLFVRRRQKYPRADIAHRITHRPITKGKVFLCVTVTISNTGEVLISLASGVSRIQQTLPLPSELLVPINEGHDLVEEGETEILWPLIGLRKSKWGKGQLEIEPGASEQLRYDFIIDAEVQTIRVYSFFRNIVKHDREIGWDLSTIYDLRSS